MDGNGTGWSGLGSMSQWEGVHHHVAQNPHGAWQNPLLPHPPPPHWIGPMPNAQVPQGTWEVPQPHHLPWGGPGPSQHGIHGLPYHFVPEPGGSLPLTDSGRIRRHDAKLWKREQNRARRDGKATIRCPCLVCGGGTKCTVINVGKHLRAHGRHPSMRLWPRWEGGDTSDEEWNGLPRRFRRPMDQSIHIGRPNIEQGTSDIPLDGSEPNLDERMVDPPEFDRGVQTRRMLNEAFTDLDRFEDDDPGPQAEAGPTGIPPGEGDVPEEAVGEGDGQFDTAGAPEDQDAFTEEEDEQSIPALLRDALEPLYEGSRRSKLAFIVLFLNTCANHAVPNVFVDEMLALLREEIFPKVNNAPKNMNECKAVMRKLGLNYVKIHSCKNGCSLFYKEHLHDTHCHKCGMARYKDVGKCKVPLKVLRWFPIIPRLLRMYRCKSISELQTWTAKNKSTDGLVRHAGDSEQWKDIDTKWPEFANEVRNIRFGLALDGVNPFGDKNNNYSTWPVMLLNYNLPPWLTTKRFFVMLALIIPGPESVTSANIDVFMEPLVDELKQLWAGVQAYDVNAERRNRRFLLRGMLMWTINDFPAYGLISGQCTKGYRACPVCGPRITSVYSKPMRKLEFLGHRRWLPRDHKYRSQAYAKHFNGKQERAGPPGRTSSSEVLAWAADKTKHDEENPGRENGRDDPYKNFGVKRRSILFDLPYWKDLLIRHTVDVMHTEKNICESLIRFLFGQKDTVDVRQDLKVQWKIRKHLWVQRNPARANGMERPVAPYVLTSSELKTFLNRAGNLRVPSDYAGAFRKHVKERKLGNMKSHDYHVMMHDILPHCLRGLMHNAVRSTILNLCSIFRRICTKAWDPRDLPKLKEDVALTLCQLEMHFPPAFFDIMTHLLVHLVEEVGICGPVTARWMYPMERFMKLLKTYVRMNARPEGSMAEGYIMDEGLGFVTEYLEQFEAVSTRIWDSNEEEGVAGVVLEGKGTPITLSQQDRDSAHTYVLLNIDIMEPWREKYVVAKEAHQGQALFPSLTTWIRAHIRDHKKQHPDLDLELYSLSKPPSVEAWSYRRVTAYGNHFRVADEASALNTTYDSGMIVVGSQPGTAEGGVVSEMGYVGELQDIVFLNYGGSIPVPVILMRGKWVVPTWRGTRRGMSREKGFILANFHETLPPEQDPFVFPSQVEQAFFMDVERRPGWKTVLHKDPRARRVQHDRVHFVLEIHAAFAPADSCTEPIEVPADPMLGAVPLTRAELDNCRIDYDAVEIPLDLDEGSESDEEFSDPE